MKARRRFPPRAWLYTAAAILILSPATTIVAQTIKGDSAAEIDKASKWMPWDAVSPAETPPRPLKSAVQRELNALYAEHGQKAPEMSSQAAASTESHPTVRSTSEPVSRPVPQRASHAASRVGTIGLPKLNFSKLDVSKLEFPKVERPGFDVRGMVRNIFPRKIMPTRQVRTATVRRSKAAPLGQPKVVQQPTLAAQPSKAPSQVGKVVHAGGTADESVAEQSTTTETSNERAVRQVEYTAKTAGPRTHLHGPFHVVSPTYAPALSPRGPARTVVSKLSTAVHHGIKKITRSPSLLSRLSSPLSVVRSATGRQVPSRVPTQSLPPRPTVISKRETQNADRKPTPSAKDIVTKEQLASGVEEDSGSKIQTTSQETVTSVKTDADSPYRERFRLIAERRGQKGLKGFCPVALRDGRDLKDAKPEFASVHRSHIYHFSSLEAKAAFDASPKQYAPASGGDDVVLASKTSESHKGTLDHAVWFRNRLYLFTSKVTLDMFVASPRNYAVD